MAIMEWGQGTPVVMLHGNPTWGFLYRHVVQRLLDQELRLVVPDLVGLGYSSRVSAREHTLDNHIHWLAAALEDLDLPPGILVCQDWGGAIGAGALATMPGWLRGLVVLNTVFSPPRPGFRPTAFHRLAQFPGLSHLVFRGLGFPQRALHLAQGDPSTLRGRVRQAYISPLGRAPVAPLAMARMVPDSPEHPSIDALSRSHRFVESFKGPTEIVWGDRDPVLGKVIGHMQRLFPHAQVTRTQGGHFLQEEVPGPIAEAIKRVAAAL